MYLANVHALREDGGGWAWLARAGAEAAGAAEAGAESAPPLAGVICAAELAAEAASLPPWLAQVTFVPMEEADARASGEPGEQPLLALGVTAAYAQALRGQLEAAADAAAGHLAAGRRVVVACRYGANRSASTVLALLARHRATPLADGLAALRAARPKVYPNIETWPALLAIEADALGAASLTEEELLAHHAWAPHRRAARANARALAAHAAAAAAAAAATPT